MEKFCLKIFLLTLIFSQSSLLADSRKNIRPWLGVGIEGHRKGILVNNVMNKTPAEKSGIFKNDIIITLDGVKVSSPKDLVLKIQKKGVGHTIKLRILRSGKKIVKIIRLVAMPTILEVAKMQLLNKPVPNFKAKILFEKNKVATKSNFLGKVTIIEFWATWCRACLESFPRLNEFAQKNKEKINVFAVSSEKISIIKKFLRKKKGLKKRIKKGVFTITYLEDIDGKMNTQFYSNFIPMFILIDKKGIVRMVEVGGGQVLESVLQKALSL